MPSTSARTRSARNPVGAGRAVLVTGASRGAGLRTCRALAERGFQVYAGARGDGPHTEIRGVRVVQLDVTDEASIEGAVDAVRAAGEKELYGLVNNAGIIIQGPMELVPESELRRQFDVNVFGPARLTQAFTPLLRAGRGRVVNISAPTGRIAMPFLGPLSASKHALQALSDATRLELGHWGIRVVVIEPGSMETEIFSTAASASEKVLASLPPAQTAMYKEQFELLGAAAAKMKQHSPDYLANAVVKALTAGTPKPRYTVGPDTRLVGLLARLPLRTRDGLIMRMFGLSKLKPAAA